jgi:hypothetical protein
MPSTIFLIPLDNCAAWHRGPFERHNTIQLPLADDHAAAMLPEMARQVLNSHRQLKVFSNARMPDVEAGMMKGVGRRICFAAPLPLPHEARQSLESIFVKPIALPVSRAADLPR